MVCFCLSYSAFCNKWCGLSPKSQPFCGGGFCNAEPRTPRGTSAEAPAAQANRPFERAQPSGLRHVQILFCRASPEHRALLSRCCRAAGGSGLKRLEVLWMSRCGLQDTGGASALLPSLRHGGSVCVIHRDTRPAQHVSMHADVWLQGALSLL